MRLSMKIALPAAAAAVFLTGPICWKDGCHKVNQEFPDMGACRAAIEMLSGKGQGFLALTCGPQAPEEHQALAKTATLG